ncbi:mpv17-like protein 2 [Convolutriloba macropyga]|uniref:mpv17-like protein 2 n=1 Tax=Convolutriloba macropyga TaxID=536237 RepID=UPI003F51D598
MAWRKAFSGKMLWVTNTASSFALYFLGDVVAQKIESYRELNPGGQLRKQTLAVMAPVDWKRATRMACMSFIISPWQTGFYLFLDKRLPGLTVKTIFCKIFFDQLNAAPLYMSFITCLAYLEGNTWSQSINQCKEKFVPIYALDLCIWPTAQFANFYWVKPAFRVTYVNIVTFAWNIILSICVHNKEEKVGDNPSKKN